MISGEYFRHSKAFYFYADDAKYIVNDTFILTYTNITFFCRCRKMVSIQELYLIRFDLEKNDLILTILMVATSKVTNHEKMFIFVVYKWAWQPCGFCPAFTFLSRFLVTLTTPFNFVKHFM